jgi:hypothetical protein
MNETIESTKVMIPINFPDVQKLVDGTNLKPDKMKVLLNQMYVSRLRKIGFKKKELKYRANRSYDEGYVTLKADHLKSILGSRYKKYVDFLCTSNLVQKRKSTTSEATYRPGEMSIQYKFRLDLLHSPNTIRRFRKETVTDRCTIKAILRERIKRQMSAPIRKRVIEPEEIHLSLFQMEKIIKFDLKAAEEWVIKYLATNHLDEAISDNLIMNLEIMASINEDPLTLKIDCFGERMHTPIKTVSKLMRPFMFFEGHKDEDIVSIDIRNSQLYFVNFLFDPAIVDTIIPEFSIITAFTSKYKDEEDVKRFRELTTNGTIYTSWQNTRKLNTRDEAKGELFSLLFSTVYSPSPGRKEFKKLYPNIWKCFDFIKSLSDEQLKFIPKTYANKKGKYSDGLFYKNLSCSLQRLESRVFLKNVCKDLVSAGIAPFLTVHDSIFILSKNQNLAEEIIRDGFNKLGLCPPKFKIESNKIKNLR